MISLRKELRNTIQWTIKIRRKKNIKKKGWLGIRILAATMGIGYVPFI